MGRLAKIVLELTILNVIASVLFLSGVVDVSGFPGLYVVIPLAAVGYGMFVICLALEKEAAGFDSEHRTPPEVTGPDSGSGLTGSFHDHEHHEPAHV
jgi:hypothetical protein